MGPQARPASRLSRSFWSSVYIGAMAGRGTGSLRSREVVSVGADRMVGAREVKVRMERSGLYILG